MANKYCFILGTRPEIIKLYSLIKEAEHQGLDYFIIHTNQHYDEKMDGIFFKELALPKPAYNLHIGSGSHADQIARMMVGIDEVLKKEQPTHVFVQGDTNTVLAGALVASRLMIKVVHIEAGLRSYDRTMPEEINRIVTDHIADYLMAPNAKQKEILLHEGIEEGKIAVVGNTVVDAVNDFKLLVEKRGGLLKELGLKPGYLLLTCHRPSNTDSEENFLAIITAAAQISKDLGSVCIFPMHPRLTAKRSLVDKYPEIRIISPVGYLEMLELEGSAGLILTDSGGVQEEASILHKKCLILRLNTERPEALSIGGSELIEELSTAAIVKQASELVAATAKWPTNPFGDGRTAEKVFKILEAE